MNRTTLSNLRTTALVSLGVAVLVALLRLVPALAELELKALDWRFQARGVDSTMVGMDSRADVVLIALSDQDRDVLPGTPPYPRSLYAHAVENLRLAGVKAVGIDLLFTKPDPHGPQEDERFRAALSARPDVVLAGRAPTHGFGGLIRLQSVSHSGLENAYDDAPGATIASVEVPDDPDGVARRYWPTRPAPDEQRIPSFGLALARKDRPSLDSTGLPRDLDGAVLLDFYGPRGTFRTVSLGQVVDDSLFVTEEEKRVRAEMIASGDAEGVAAGDWQTNDFDALVSSGTLRGKVAILGTADPEDKDYFPAPMSRDGSSMMAGMELHATFVQNLLDGRALHRLPGWLLELSLALLAGLVYAGSSRLRRAGDTRLGRSSLATETVNAAAVVLLSVLIVGGSLAAFSKLSLILPMVPMLEATLVAYGAAVVGQVVSERRQKQAIRGMFGTYVHPTVVDLLIADPEMMKLGGVRKEMTVLFSDIQGFTPISEAMDAEELVNLLNDYLGPMTDVVKSTGGALDKYVGDCVMAFWGAPGEQPDHAMRACKAALAMQTRLTDLRPVLKARYGHEIFCRIGINSGPMVVGNMGSAERFNYTVMGDAVNLAARLEGANKQFGTQILISQFTLDAVGSRVEARPLGEVTVKGKSQSVPVYELISLADRTPTLWKTLHRGRPTKHLT